MILGIGLLVVGPFEALPGAVGLNQTPEAARTSLWTTVTVV